MIPKSILELEKLEVLYLSGNPLNRLPDYLADMPNLKEIHCKCMFSESRLFLEQKFKSQLIIF